jgi:hypothetical protein
MSETQVNGNKPWLLPAITPIHDTQLLIDGFSFQQVLADSGT